MIFSVIEERAGSLHDFFNYVLNHVNILHLAYSPFELLFTIRTFLYLFCFSTQNLIACQISDIHSLPFVIAAL